MLSNNKLMKVKNYSTTNVAAVFSRKPGVDNVASFLTAQCLIFLGECCRAQINQVKRKGGRSIRVKAGE